MTGDAKCFLFFHQLEKMTEVEDGFSETEIVSGPFQENKCIRKRIFESPPYELESF